MHVTRGLLPRLAALAGKALAAVRDFGFPCGHALLEPLGWSMAKPYFNAGLMVLDTQVPPVGPLSVCPADRMPGSTDLAEWHGHGMVMSCGAVIWAGTMSGAARGAHA